MLKRIRGLELRIKKDATVRGIRGGYIIIIQTVLFMAIAVAIIIAVINPIVSGYTSARAFTYSKQSFLVADSAMEDALYRLGNNKTIGSSETVTLASGASTVNIATTPNGKMITSAGVQNSFNRNLTVNLRLGTGISFHYGIQSGNGGFELGGNSGSYVLGNVFSGGPVVGTGQGNLIKGDVISAGASGLINNIQATGTAYAHTIQNSTINKDAHYYNASTIDSYTTSHVTGTLYPGSADLPNAALPITDTQIAEWESDAASGGTATCSGTYSITGSTTSIGPLKIPCDLSIKNSTVTITGPIWVTGNIDVKGSTVQMSSSLNSQNVALIADNPSNTTGSGIITTDTSTNFYAAGCPSACIAGAFVFLISQNTNEETNHNGSVDAVNIGQSSSGLVAYAAHGMVTVGQSVNLKEVTAYKIRLANSAIVIYDTGLPNSLFESGPGGGYDMLGWTEN